MGKSLKDTLYLIPDFDETTYPVKIFFSFLFPIGDESLVLNPEADDIPVLELISPSEKKLLKNLKSSKRR